MLLLVWMLLLARFLVDGDGVDVLVSWMMLMMLLVMMLTMLICTLINYCGSRLRVVMMLLMVFSDDNDNVDV